jgi:hypothetical protein
LGSFFDSTVSDLSPRGGHLSFAAGAAIRAHHIAGDIADLAFFENRRPRPVFAEGFQQLLEFLLPANDEIFLGSDAVL